jgi:hypothetical protein
VLYKGWRVRGSIAVNAAAGVAVATKAQASPERAARVRPIIASV